MAKPELEFTNLTGLRAEAIGEPGQRTFRILAESGSSSAIIWLEKEQLFQLALAINQLLATQPESPAGTDIPTRPETQPPPTNVEFKAGHLVLGHDGKSGRFMIDAHEAESSESAPHDIRFWSERSQAGAFAEEALRACASGRPLCPLCGSPIDSSGHRCPRSNGHRLLDLETL